MPEIQLTKGYVAVVDDEDFEWLSQWKWHAKVSHRGDGSELAYALRRVGKNGPFVRMHREVAERCGLGTPSHVDHKDGNGLNNTRANLRAATHSENLCNRPKNSNNKSGFKGVCWNKGARKWQAEIKLDYKSHYLGLFESPEEAHAAYCEAAVQLHAGFARTA